MRRLARVSEYNRSARKRYEQIVSARARTHHQPNPAAWLVGSQVSISPALAVIEFITVSAARRVQPTSRPVAYTHRNE